MLQMQLGSISDFCYFLDGFVVVLCRCQHARVVLSTSQPLDLRCLF